ncbi:hypothetical protein L7F22_043146 [Adiantum nelumboides]|nr:hypothetical protein [Adiantum nelumboides]
MKKKVEFTHKGKKYEIQAGVSGDTIPMTHNENQDQLKCLEKYEDCFSEDLPCHLLPERPEEHYIDIMPDSSPPKIAPYREIEFFKWGPYLEEELDVVVNTLRLSSNETVKKGLRQNYKKQHESRKKSQNKKGALDSLEAMGVKVYGQDNLSGQLDISWDIIAGYHEQKREIEDTILLALRCPEVYDSIARGTRRKFESNRPRAILFESPPGTGKTSSARVIATQSGVPLLYVPLEAVVSEYYGESERMLSKVFNTANDLDNGAIIFLDEIDSIAMTRDNEMHEATRRMSSVLLRQIDGFEQDNRVVIIAATNRKEDLDPALISRFDSSIIFGLPDKQTREEIAAQYARHLTPDELTAIAASTEGMSGRDLRDICQQAERRWASEVIRTNANTPMAHGLPPVDYYIVCAVKEELQFKIKSEVCEEEAKVRRLNPMKMEIDDAKVEEPSTSTSASTSSLKGVSKIGDMTIIDIDGLNQEHVWKVFEFMYNSAHYGVQYKELTQRQGITMLTAGFQGILRFSVDDHLFLIHDDSESLVSKLGFCEEEEDLDYTLAFLENLYGFLTILNMAEELLPEKVEAASMVDSELVESEVSSSFESYSMYSLIGIPCF